MRTGAAALNIIRKTLEFSWLIDLDGRDYMDKGKGLFEIRNTLAHFSRFELDMLEKLLITFD